MSDPQPTKSNPTREYIAGGANGTWSARSRVLPWAFDDLSMELGDNVYERMLNDAQVAANIRAYKASVLEDSINLTSAVPNKDADGYAQAAELVEVCAAQFDDMETGLDESLDSLLDAIAVGCKVAEEVYALDATYTGKTQYVLRALKVKPRRATALVVDAFDNIIGLRGNIVQPSDGMSATRIEVLDRKKFLIFPFKPKDGDPRGSTLLRQAYNAYDLKMRTWPEYYKYLVQFASPSVVGVAAPNAVDETDPDDPTKVVSAVQALFLQLLNFQNGSAIAVPNGAEVDIRLSQGEGKAFLEAFGLFDRQITTAILGQTRATMEAEHGSKADSETGKGIFDTFVQQTRQALARRIRQDVLMDLVEYNYGPEARRLAPMISFGEVKQTNRIQFMTAVAALERVDYFDPSQLPDLDLQIGVTARTPEEMAHRIEQAANPPPPPPTLLPGSSPQNDEQPDDQPDPKQETTNE